jgi:hypothetical protein
MLFLPWVVVGAEAPGCYAPNYGLPILLRQWLAIQFPIARPGCPSACTCAILCRTKFSNALPQFEVAAVRCIFPGLAASEVLRGGRLVASSIGHGHLSVSLVGGTPCPSLPMQITAANFHCQQYFAK